MFDKWIKSKRIIFLSGVYCLILMNPIQAFSQSVKVNINAKGLSIRAFVSALERECDYHISYRDKTIENEKNITYTAQNESLEKVLKDVLTPLDLQYTIAGKDVVVTRVEKKKPTEKRTLRGKITDERGEPIIGAAILIKGESGGIISDIDGNYSLPVSGSQKVTYSYVGYTPKTINITDNISVMDVVLSEQEVVLDEMVVVGYGTQKKSSLTGSIDVIPSKIIEKAPVANIAQSLQGVVPGLIIVDNGGKPGSTPSFNIRGVGTLGATEPLVVIDGVPAGMGDFYALSPVDIESVSVLKDAASAAIYGSRASNGVLVVTTRCGNKESLPVVNIGYSFSSQSPTKVPKLVDSWDYAALVNESYLNAGGSAQYTDDQIQMMRDNSNPDYYTNTNWWKAGVRNHDSMNQANIRVAGGSSQTTYMLSASYTNQQGLVELTDFSKVSTRLNLSTKIIDNLSIEGGASYYRDNSKQPDHYSNFFDAVLNMPPYLPVKRANGDWGHLNNEDTNPIAWINDGGHTKSYNNNMFLNAYATWEIIRGLKLKGQTSYNLWNVGSSSIYRTIRFVNEDGSEKFSNYPNSVSKSMTERNQWTLQATLDYEKQLGAHNIKGIIGYTEEMYNSTWVGGSRKNIPDNEMEEIDGATGTGDFQTSWGSSDAWRMRSYFGRINYDYNSKYFAEVNARYDGSSRLAPGKHYAFFPSGSIGWRISEEVFMESTRPVLYNLKIRASYGGLGNQTIGLYQYADVMGNNPQEYMFGHLWVPGAYVNILPNYNLTWERSTILDLGVDFGLWTNRLTGSFDWYKKKTDGILLEIPVSAVIGKPVAVQNAGKMSNWGYELQLSWRDNIGKVNYSVNFSLSDQMNRVDDLKGTGPYKYNSTIIAEGKALNTLYGYKCAGFFTSEEDIKNSPKPEGYASQIKIGDLKYVDISGPDGVPDGKIDSNDRTDLGWSAPRYMYGLDINGEWNGFDLRIFFQGVGKRDEFVYGGIVFNPGSKFLFDDRWNPAKSVEDNLANAKLPRLVNGQQNNYEISSFYVKNAAYIRLKNLQIGYTLPQKITRKISFEKVRFYASASNLFTLTKFPYMDPEGSSGGAYYPQLFSFAFGVDITIGKK